MKTKLILAFLLVLFLAPSAFAESRYGDYSSDVYMFDEDLGEDGATGIRDKWVCTVNAAYTCSDGTSGNTSASGDSRFGGQSSAAQEARENAQEAAEGMCAAHGGVASITYSNLECRVESTLH